MNDLEKAVRPIVGPMMQRKARVLSLRDQAVVSAWASKTAMVLAYTFERYEVTESRRRFLFETQRVPPLTEVWLAAYSSPEEGVVASIERLTAQLAGSKDRTCLLVTWAIGPAVFQVVEVPFAGLESSRDLNSAVRVHPSREKVVIWPPRHALGPTALHDFSHQFVEPELRPKRLTHERGPLATRPPR
jgi:hypothetical protein